MAIGPTTPSDCLSIPCDGTSYIQRWCAATRLSSDCGATPTACYQGGADCQDVALERNAQWVDPFAYDWELDLPWAGCQSAFRCVKVVVEVRQLTSPTVAGAIQRTVSNGIIAIPTTFDKAWHYYRGTVGSFMNQYSYSIWDFAMYCGYY